MAQNEENMLCMSVRVFIYVKEECKSQTAKNVYKILSHLQMIESEKRTSITGFDPHSSYFRSYNQVAENSPGRQPCYFSHFDSTSFGPPSVITPLGRPRRARRKFIGRACRSGAMSSCRDEDLQWYCRIVGRGEVGSNRV